MLRRHHEVTRLEGFSDAVFAFALTLLVVSLEAPKTFADLQDMVRQSVPFALMFAMVCWIWYEHNLFFRRYGLQDGWTAFLNCVLLFVVLFYVYPLKFLTSRLPWFSDMRPHEVEDIPTEAAAVQTMVIYSTGLVLIFAAFSALYLHAWRQRKHLDLSAHDVVRLRSAMRGHLLVMAIGLLSVALAHLGGHYVAVSGFVYFLIGPALTWNGFMTGRAERALTKRVADDYPTP